MYPFLYKYFLINKKLVLPNIGTFTMEEIPASLDFVKGLLKAPQTRISFTRSESATIADRNLIIYLSKEMKVEEWQTARNFLEFTQSILNNIVDNIAVELPGIGKLQHGIDKSNIVFIPNEETLSTTVSDIKLNNPNDTRANLVELYTVGENFILTEETEADKLEQIVKEKEEDYWWIYAIVLGLMVIGALFYYNI
jgi:hypothetical protein